MVEEMTENRKKVPCTRKPSETTDECESLLSCTDTSTSTGNILDRMIHHSSGPRELELKQWPAIFPKMEDLTVNNNHQYKASLKTNHLNQMCSLRVSSDPNTYRQPAIIGTLGPSNFTVDAVLELLEAGMNVARVNMAHVDPCNKISIFQNIIEATNIYSASIDYTIPIATMMDLKGPEIRTGKIASHSQHETSPIITFEKGQLVRLTSDKIFKDRCTKRVIYIDSEVLAIHVQPGTEIHISNGTFKLRVEAVETFNLLCRVEEEGVLRNYQQVHIPMVPLPMPSVTEYDIECLNLAVEREVDVVAVPKVRNSDTVYRVKDILEEKQKEGQKILVFAKISNYEGIRNIDSIITAADGIVIQKNDLIVEIPTSKLFIAQKEIISKCNLARKPVVCTANLKTPNSSEVASDLSHIAQSIVDGSDCLMMTAETAVGKNGPNDIRRLCEIMREAEAATMQNPYYYDLTEMLTPAIEPSIAVALAAVEVANKMQAPAILTITTSGKTAHLLSWFRPRCPVIAITRVGRTARQLNFWRAVIPLFYAGPLLNDWFEDCGARIQYGISYGKEKGIIRPGDPLVLVTGYRKQAGFTNSLRIVFASLEGGQYVDNPQLYYQSAK